MNNIYPTNEERTSKYLTQFNREKVLKYLIKEINPVIFDVGANDGLSLKEFKAWWSNSTVHCFEPQTECWDRLEDIAGEYEKSNVVINRTAVGHKSEENSNFYSHNVSSGLSGFNKVNIDSKDSIDLEKLKSSDDSEHLEGYYKELNHRRSVKVVRLDEYMDSYKINYINLLKIDTQGYEPEVIAGLGEKLNNVGVLVTELMFYDYYERSLSFSDIESYLLPAGFQLYDISHIAKNPMNGRTDWVDVIYVNKSILSKS
jgi:FkbM family methyltransferase